MQKIILVGYMAVGKTKIAHLLSEKTGFKRVDIDKLIENKINLSVSEIFKQKGEIFFRKTEHEVFREVVESNENLIISTGGGTPCYADNHLLLNGGNVISVYLKASIATILKRLGSSKKERPLVADKSTAELKEFVAKHLFERSYFYNQAAFTISVDDKKKEAVADEIMALLH